MTPDYIYWTAPLIIINLAAAAVTVSDKRRARRGLRRVPEKTLLWIAALGGSPAMLAAMLIVRHKTRRPKFMLGLPAILILQIAAVWYLGNRFGPFGA